MTTYALNGLGRIGKLALRPLLESGAKIACPLLPEHLPRRGYQARAM